MSTKPIHVAQISDLHIKAPGLLAYGRVDTAKALEHCVTVLNELDPAPDFVVISGDLADTPTSEEYQHLNGLLAPLKLPFACVPGNHDSRELMRAAYPSSPYAFASGPLNQKIEVNGLDLLLLDSSVHGKPYGELEEVTLQWLDATLAASRGRPALLFLHHPPFKTGIWHMDRQNLLNASEFRAHPATSFARAIARHRPCSPRCAHVVCRGADDDLPGSEPRGRTRSGRVARALVQGRAASVPPPQLVSG